MKTQTALSLRAVLLLVVLFYPSILVAAEMKLPPINLPEDTGKEEVDIYCGACHSLRLVIQQRMNRKAWEEVLEYMVDEHEMDKLEDKDRTLVLDYLAKHYGY